METFAERIRSLRGKLSQKQFADVLGTSQKNISVYEKGGLPETKTLLIIQEKLNVSIDWLLKGIGQREFIYHSGVTDLQMQQAAIEIIESVREKYLKKYEAPARDVLSKKNCIKTISNYAIYFKGISLN